MVVVLFQKDAVFQKCLRLLESDAMKYQKTRKHKSHGGIQKDLCKSDFYMCINKSWLRSVHVPPFKSAFGISEEIEQQIERQLFTLATKSQDAFRKTKTTTSLETMVGGIVDSALKTANQPKNIQTLQANIGRLHCLQTTEDVGKVLGEYCRAKIGTLFYINGTYVDTQQGNYCLQIQRGSIGLPDRLYYEDTSPGRWKTLHFYKQYLDKLSERLGIESLSSIIEIEKKLAPFILMKKINETPKEKRGSVLESTYRHIPWNELFNAYGLTDWRRRVYRLESEEWTSIVNTLFAKEKVAFFKLLFTSQLIHHSVAYLPPPYDDFHYEFFRKRLRGQALKLPQKYLMLEVLTEYATPFLSKLYKEEFLEDSFRRKAIQFAKEIQAAASHRMDAVEWLHPQTREAAKEKIQKMRLSIAYPDSFDVTPLPIVDPECLLDTIFSLESWKTEKELNRLGTTRNQQKGWDDPIYAVNGYYYSDENELIIPAGSLLSPFYDESKPLGWNYGGVGVVMGHEITHAFDEEGKEYDPAGHRKSWWMPQDKKNFEEKTKQIVKVFSSQRILGHSVNGETTLSENIADLGGLAIALDALNLELEKRKVSFNQRKHAHQQFFISYAVSWRIKEKKEKQIHGLLVDRHAPTPLRVNLIVSQFQEWYEAFDIDEKDPIFVKPTKRLMIF